MTELPLPPHRAASLDTEYSEDNFWIISPTQNGNTLAHDISIFSPPDVFLHNGFVQIPQQLDSAIFDEGGHNLILKIFSIFYQVNEIILHVKLTPSHRFHFTFHYHIFQ